MATRRFPYVLLTLLLSACGSAASSSPVDVPTLIVLPGQTLEQSSPTSTPAPPCDIAPFWDQADDMLTRFLDTAEVAAASPRSSLGDRLLEMRDLQRQVEAISVPECANSIKSSFAAGMHHAIEGMNALLGGDTLSAVFELGFASSSLREAANSASSYIRVEDARLFNADQIWGGVEVKAETATALFDPQLTQTVAAIYTSVIETMNAHVPEGSTPTPTVTPRSDEELATIAVINTAVGNVVATQTALFAGD